MYRLHQHGPVSLVPAGLVRIPGDPVGYPYFHVCCIFDTASCVPSLPGLALVRRHFGRARLCAVGPSSKAVQLIRPNDQAVRIAMADLH